MLEVSERVMEMFNDVKEQGIDYYDGGFETAACLKMDSLTKEEQDQLIDLILLWLEFARLQLNLGIRI